jgi:hypothetical protein
MGSSQTDRKNVKSKCDVIWPQTTLDEKWSDHLNTKHLRS